MEDDWFDDSESLYPEGMDGPTVRTPSVDVPTPSGDVFQRSEIARLFVLHVIVWNAVILLLSVGAMLVYFRNDWDTGRQLLATGAVLAVYGIYRWPRGTDGAATSDDRDADESENETQGGGEGETEDGDSHAGGGGDASGKTGDSVEDEGDGATVDT